MNNDVFVADDGYLIARSDYPNEDNLKKNLAAAGKFMSAAKENGINCTAAFAGRKADVCDDRLPAVYGSYYSDRIWNITEELCDGDGIDMINLRNVLRKAEESGDEVYYKTDHHWNSHGAYLAYAAIADSVGYSAYQESDFTVECAAKDFLGTTWSSSGATWVKPDSIYTWVSDKLGVQVIAYPNGKPVEGQLYVRDKLDTKDKYSMFLGGNQPLCVVKNPSAAQGKLLVIRDSYSDSLAPFLALDYQEVHLFDLRYNLTPISQYVEENGIDQVLVLYSAENFSTDNSVTLMAR